MIYLKYQNYIEKIMNNEVFKDKVKIKLQTEKQVDLVIKGLTYDEAINYEAILKSLGIDEIKNLARIQDPSKSSSNYKLKIVGIKCNNTSIIDTIFCEGVKINYVKYKTEHYIKPIHVIQCHNCNRFGLVKMKRNA
jgi:hypothetical protein